MNTQRDKFLTEYMGECYHDFVIDHSAVNPYKCKKCDFWHGIKLQNDFSAWLGFSKLLVLAKKENWWDLEFAREYLIPEYDPEQRRIIYAIPLYLVNPDNLADAVYEFLKGHKS